MSLQKKINKLKREPKLFFKDMFLKRYIPLKNKVKSVTPKKKYGYCKYAIVSAVYNVEKYLDDYFKSIINQRLDFKNNIHIILVDDGSIDNSANIIKKYQKKYPKNITYIYKENGGQASARNLGLKLLQEDPNLKDKFTWVTFTDPDDFVDIDYFYEVDEFLQKNEKYNIACVVCAINTFNTIGVYRKHPANFFTKSHIPVSLNDSTLDIITTSTRSFFLINDIKNMQLNFDTNIKTFEDCKFYLSYIQNNRNNNKYITYLSSAIYYARKRPDSTMKNIDLENYIKSLYTIQDIFQNNIQSHGTVLSVSQNVSLFHLFYLIKDIVDNNLKNINLGLGKNLLHVLDDIFSKISVDTILDSTINKFSFHYKIGMLHCFKNVYPPFNRVYINDIDHIKQQICIRYFTPYPNDVESIQIDGKEIYADYEKIRQYNFLTRVFVYEKILWINIPKDSLKLEIFLKGQRAKIYFANKSYKVLDIKNIFHTIHNNIDSIWLLVDKDIAADDNAEHFYRYMMKNHPTQNIVFSLRKDSKDWDRLEKEGFNLVDFGSYAFETTLKSCSKIISSHIDGYLVEYFGKNTLDNKQFIFLQHGIIKDDLSNWLNNKQIDCFITSTKNEYDSIADNFNHYKFSNKEVALTGLARHDALLEKNTTNTKQILIMPTWRKTLVGVTNNSSKREFKEGFKDSEYYIKWNDVLNSNMLKNIYEKYNYKIIFNPHPNMIPYLNDFTIPDFVDIADSNASLQDLFANSSVMITDYSSVAFEMGYLKKPVIYYQFDEEEFFNSHTYTKGYFDYKRDGFGPVVTTQEELLIELKNLVKNNCQVGEPYRSNIENTFAFRDGKCCERIYQAIVELDKPYESKITTEQIRQKAKDALEYECFYEASCRYRYILENSQTIDISDVEQYLYCALKSNNGYEASKFILSIEDKTQFNTHIKIEIIKGVLSKDKNSKEEIEWILNALENIQVGSDELLSLTWAKLRVYIYLEKREKIKEIINTLKTKFNISKDEIDLELYLLRNNILAASTSGGGATDRILCLANNCLNEMIEFIKN